MSIERRNRIGFEFSEGSGSTMQGVNPVTNTMIPDKFFIATPEDVDKAMRKAQAAFHAYSTSNWNQRAAFLETIADEMEALGDVLVKKASEETGLPEARIIGERGRTTSQLRMFASYIRTGNWVEATIDTAIPDRTPVPKPDLRKMMVPLGPVVVFGASNFPLAYSVAGGDTAAALAAGCPVLVKAHPGHPGTSALVGEAIIKAAKKHNMPDGVFSLLFDNGFAVGQALVGHPHATAVGFTGSVGGGRALFDIAAKRPNPIPVFAEMGSTNPVILLPQALKVRAKAVAEEYAGSITLGVGQFCTNPGLLFGIKGEELEVFKKHLKNAFVQTNPGTMLHEGIEKAFVQKSGKMLSEPDVAVLVESDAQASTGQGRPTVAAAKGSEFITNPALHEEVFGPFSMLIECENAKELKECVKALHGQLTGTLIGEPSDFKVHVSIAYQLQQKVGRLIFNGVPTGVEVCPSMMHGGPYPATTDSRFTAVGIHSIKRFLRPVAFQNTPQELLPDPLKNENPNKILRLIDNEYTTKSI
ncbi:MAG: aldehyde dehydrogenase (NADP(+)) [Cyclobacteriaceae bacterium]|nr:aldehyde dehydrogenase (NADP(+)) [Cyclobacteriaceae bacterium]